MKKAFLIFVALIFVSMSLMAEDGIKTINLDGKQSQGKLKAGVSLGYPTGLTAGWRPSEAFELNLLVGTHYTDFVIGVSPMFTIANIDIKGEIFPLSVGPAAYLNIDWFTDIDIDILGNVRLEYSFKQIPLNLFLEGGFGIKLDLGNTPLVKPQGSGALGIRYIF